MYTRREQRLPHPRRDREPGRRAAVPQPREEPNRPQLVLQLGDRPPRRRRRRDTTRRRRPSPATRSPRRTSTSATFTFTGIDDVTPAGSLTFECQLDVPTRPPWTRLHEPADLLRGLAAGLAHRSGSAPSTPRGTSTRRRPVYTWTIDQTRAGDDHHLRPAGVDHAHERDRSPSRSPETGVDVRSARSTAAPSRPAPRRRRYTDLARRPAHLPGARDRRGRQRRQLRRRRYPWTIQPAAAARTAAPRRRCTAVADSWIEQSSPSSNKGTDSILKVMSKSGNANLRALVRFDLPTIPAGCVLDTATLRLYAASASASAAHAPGPPRSTARGRRGGVTWANQPATTGTAATTTSGTGYREWDVAALVAGDVLQRARTTAS